MVGLAKIVHKINPNLAMVHELNHYTEDNVYNKPITHNGLWKKLFPFDHRLR